MRRFLGSVGPADRQRTPWWARWLVEIIVVLVAASGFAWLVDWLWFEAPVAQCWLFAMVTFPIGFAAPVGFLLLAVGMVVAIAGRRGVGIALLVGGALLATAPDLMPGGGLPGCA